MAVSPIATRPNQGNNDSDAYRMRLTVNDGGSSNAAGQRLMTYNLEGYAANPYAGYTSFNSPRAWVNDGAGNMLAGQNQISNWWPRDTWVSLMSGSFYATPGSQTFYGHFNSNTSSYSYVPMNGDWYCTLTMDVPAIAPSNVSISLNSVSRTSITINRQWTNATECNYNINGQGWQAEGTTLNGIYCNSNDITGLQPNKSYTIKVRFRNYTSAWVESNQITAKTTCNKPTNVSISSTSKTYNSIAVKVSATGDTNAPITNYTVYYRTGSAAYTSKSLGTGTTTTITGLKPNTTYNLYVTAANAGGTTQSSTINVTTNKPAKPTISTPTKGTVTVNSIAVSVTANAGSGASISKMEFSKDNGTSWINNGTSKSYTFTGLTPNTTYNIKARVTDNYSQTTTSGTLQVTTNKPAKPTIRSFSSSWETDGTYEFQVNYYAGEGASIETATYTMTNQADPSDVRTSALAGPNKTNRVLDLTPGASYTLYIEIIDNYAQSATSTRTVDVPISKYVKVITSEGTKDAVLKIIRGSQVIEVNKNRVHIVK